jgi:hypothetical protein
MNGELVLRCMDDATASERQPPHPMPADRSVLCSSAPVGLLRRTIRSGDGNGAPKTPGLGERGTLRRPAKRHDRGVASAVTVRAAPSAGAIDQGLPPLFIAFAVDVCSMKVFAAV